MTVVPSSKQLKALLRKESLARMKLIAQADKEGAPYLVLQRCRQLPSRSGQASCWQEAKRVSCFISMDHELNTRPILQALLEDGKQIYVPRIINNPNFKPGALDTKGRPYRKQIMRMLCLKSVEEIDSFAQSSYGIPEPPLDREDLMQTESVDLILCPGVVFSRDGRRIGYGGGFYDMFIRQARALSPHVTVVGVGYSCQVIHSDSAQEGVIPLEKTDEMLDFVITNES
jgi:5-formyltetrahydrofolate cyclo-ligase